MDSDTFWALFFMSLAFGTLIFCIVRGILFYVKFEKIRCGMSYDDVISIVGYPKKSDGQVSMWRIAVIRSVYITRIVTFKDNKVVSVMKG